MDGFSANVNQLILVVVCEVYLNSVLTARNVKEKVHACIFTSSSNCITNLEKKTLHISGICAGITTKLGEILKRLISQE